MKDTAEQAAAKTAFNTGENLVIEAGAGTGKTTTVRGCAEQTDRRGAYVVFNAAAAKDAKGSFPKNVRCGTSHSFAFGPVGKNYLQRINSRQRPTGRQAAAILDIDQGFSLPEDRSLTPMAIARLAQETVSRYCYTKDENITVSHVPMVPGADDVSWDLANYVLPYAKKAWRDLVNPTGKLLFNHDVYLKLWALSNPRIPAEYIFVDEAQDTNPCLMGVILQQDAQIIAVGDRCQAIYGWRGAVDAMASFPADQKTALTQSFRFGPRVATVANEFLTMLEADIRLTGFDALDTKLGSLTAATADATLCRTNGGVIQAALDTPADRRYAFVGKGAGAQIASFAKAAGELVGGGRAQWHADLGAFKSWEDAVDYANNDAGGSDIKVLVNLVQDYGAAEIERIASRAIPEERAKPGDHIISTAHKAKGREWGKVRISNDFTPSDEKQEAGMSRPEMMLAYVAVTRAQEVLDYSGLAWALGA